MIVKSKSAAAKKAPARKKAGTSARSAERAEAREENRHQEVLQTIHKEVTAEPEQEHLEDWVQVDCAYCGEQISVHVTSEQDGQTLYEDCEVCARSNSLHVHVEDGELTVESGR